MTTQMGPNTPEPATPSVHSERRARIAHPTQPEGAARANDNEGPFSIGQNVWPGISKLIEECGEVLQIAGKLIATGGRTDHWSGLDLRAELQDELADLAAASLFVAERNALDRGHMDDRITDKLALFNEWHGRSPDA
jgi:NTP pyrophosphatase (non-canonical NTP hydrolase)